MTHGRQKFEWEIYPYDKGYAGSEAYKDLWPKFICQTITWLWEDLGEIDASQRLDKTCSGGWGLLRQSSQAVMERAKKQYIILATKTSRWLQAT